MREILGPYIHAEAHSRWTAPPALDAESQDLVEFGESLYYSLRDHLHGELDSGAGQFVRDDAVEYELWLAKAAPALVKHLRPAPLPIPYSPGESSSAKVALQSALDDEDFEHSLALTSW